MSQYPEILYHYTSFDALLGIVQNQELWASSIQYMNDSMELKQALWVADACVKRYLSSPKNRTEELVRDTIDKNIEGLSGIRIYLFSLSEENDLLSQWRSYCPPNGGVAIGFKTDRLIQLVSQHGFQLVQCRYDTARQAELIDPLVREGLNDLRRAYDPDRGPGDEPIDDTRDWTGDLLKVSPMCKHPSFVEEREWRLVSEPVSIVDDRVAFRDGSGAITPFFRLPIVDDKSYVPIEHVVIGPNHDQKLASDSVSSVLQHHHAQGWRVTESEIPYRPT